MAEKRTLNRLSDRTVRTATEPGRYADGGNLYLTVRPGGSRQWVLLYRHAGKLREMGLGGYPKFSLKEARAKAEAARNLAKQGVDPLDAQREAEAKAASAKTFGVFALEYLDSIESGFRCPRHRTQWRQTLTAHCKPIWDLPIDRVDTEGVLECVKPIWSTTQETASRVRGRIERVLDAAKALKLRLGENPAAWKGNLKSLLPARPKKGDDHHHAAMAYAKLPEFIAELRARSAMSALALEFAILTAARTGEIMGARWDEIDFDAQPDGINFRGPLWTIPAARMKGKREHIVPLSTRAVEILRKLDAAKTGPLVFPAPSGGKFSNMGLLNLLRRMGYGDLTVHGFRSSFSDWASEVSSFSSETRETALAHAIKNKVEAAYRRGAALKKRQAMMEAWAQYCEPRQAENVVTFARSA